MARPAVLQYLKHGKALCGKVFRNFVETFNHVVDVTENIKGDADLPGAKKGIKVDRSNPASPIIRFVGDFGGETAGYGSSGIKVVGTDGTSAEGVTDLVFSSGSSAEVTVSVTKGSDGLATARVNVRYL